MPKLTRSQQTESLTMISKTPTQCLSRFLVLEKEKHRLPLSKAGDCTTGVLYTETVDGRKKTYLGGLPGGISSIPSASSVANFVKETSSDLNHRCELK